jgi:hypothetical protein
MSAIKGQFTWSPARRSPWRPSSNHLIVVTRRDSCPRFSAGWTVTSARICLLLVSSIEKPEPSLALLISSLLGAVATPRNAAPIDDRFRSHSFPARSRSYLRRCHRGAYRRVASRRTRAKRHGAELRHPRLRSGAAVSKESTPGPRLRQVVSLMMGHQGKSP